jgi:tripartite-type tricarboxylate transporter receptor subunit TctC
MACAFPQVAGAAAPAADAAGDYPNRPVRLIVPFPPGGSNDILGRFMAARLTEKLGQQVIVDNRPGADGLIGSEIAARAQPDGYTLLIISTSYVMNPAIHKMPFDPVKALIAVAAIGTGANAIVAHPGFAASGVKDLVALARAKPGQINYASSGIGGFNHFGGELFKSITGIDMTHVPYKGGGPAMVDVMAGQVPVLFSTIVQALPQLRSGKLKALGTGGKKRSPALPDVPTVIEQGYPTYEVPIWWGFLAPAGTPGPLVRRVNDVVAQILAETETRKRLSAEAAEPWVAQPAEFGGVITADLVRWAQVAKQANIRAH